MEQEELYQTIKSNVSMFCDLLASLTDFNIAKMQSDLHHEIENHFEPLFKALQQRKDHLIRYVDQFSTELQTRIEEEKKELIEKIEVANKLLESGTSVYQLQPDIAIGVWKKAQKITHDCKEVKRVQIELPPLLDVIKSHGKVSISNSATSGRFTPSVVSTLAGSTAGNKDGKGSNAKMRWPRGIVFNPLDDSLYVCDNNNNCIRKVTKSGEVSKFLDCNGPLDITFYQKDYCYFVTEYGTHSIIRISMHGQKSTFAGCGKHGYEDGEGEKAMFNRPWGITVNQETGDVFVADRNNHIIRKITPQGIVSTLAGTPGKYGDIDGDSQSALFNYIHGICFHPQLQAIIVCDSCNKLRKVSLDGNVSSICDIPSPNHASVLLDGSILVSSSTYRIFKIEFAEDNKMELEVFAGSGKQGESDGTPLESEFSYPCGIAIDNKTNFCYIADNSSHRIRCISNILE